MYVLAGRVRFCRGDEYYLITAGDSIFLPKGIEHTYAVVGAEARLLVIAVPSGLEIIFRELYANPGAVGISVERLVTVAARYGVEITGPPLR